jgi:glycosyltransferase involved in cell wall biosynthesis
MITDRPLRFCMITTFYPPYNFGGDGIFVHRLSNELARRGHAVNVIHCIDSYRLLAGREPERPYEDHPNVTVHGLQSPFGFCSPLATQQTGSPLFKSRRIRQILEESFDVIHYHNISLVGGPRILEYGNGIKLYTIHDYWFLCPMNVLFRFNRAPCIQRHCFTCALVYKRPPQLWRHLGLLEKDLKQVDAFIAPSQFAKEIHSQRGPELPMVHLPHFVADSPSGSTPQPGSCVERAETPYFLFVGRLEKLKGLQTIVPIFLDYQSAQLWIAGAGSYEGRLRRLASGSDNIRFLGQQSTEHLQKLYQGALAVIIPSICFEVFSLVIVEAFMHRTPVIARNIGGMPELIQASGGGFLYQTDGELLKAMNSIAISPTLRSELGEKGYHAFVLRWSNDVHLELYFDVLRQIATKKFGYVPWKSESLEGPQRGLSIAHGLTAS